MINWEYSSKIDPPRAYSCAYCERDIASDNGYKGSGEVSDLTRPFHPPESIPTRIMLCPYCGCPTFLAPAGQIPQVLPGRVVERVPDDVANLLIEARKSLAAGAPTAAAMALRKILMNVAVEKGAGTDRSWNFFKYVEYLDESGYLPPNGKGWVDKIRDFGNEAAHEIHQVTSDNAELALSRTISMLHYIYEMADEDEEAEESTAG